MTEGIIFAVLLIFFLIGLFLTWFFIHRARVKERLLLIEKGMNLSNFPKNEDVKVKLLWLKIGIVITCISIGLLISALLTDNPYFRYMNDRSTIFIFLFGGVGMILAYFTDKPKEPK